MPEPVEPTPEQVATALDAMVFFARQMENGHRLGAESYAQSGNPSSLAVEIAAEQEQWAAAFAEAVRRVRSLVPGEPLHEWECPACGATTRARMADYPGGGRA